MSTKLKSIQKGLEEYAGSMRVGFNQAVYLSEKETAHANFALAHFMASKDSLPKETPLNDMLDLYFQVWKIPYYLLYNSYVH